MKDHRVELGRSGEKIAEDYLVREGFEILHRRYRGARKEIDLIARKDQTIVFVEVKTDTSGQFGPPETWVTPRKQQAIIQAAKVFVAAEYPRADNYRFDVVGVLLRKSQPPEIHHIRGAFAAEA